MGTCASLVSGHPASGLPHGSSASSTPPWQTRSAPSSARSSTRRTTTAATTHRDQEDFDYIANPNVPAALIATLAKGTWVAAGQPCCLIGDSGTGKSHLLIGLGTAAAENGYRVKYTTAAALVNELVEAADDKTLSRTIARLGAPQPALPGPMPTPQLCREASCGVLSARTAG